MNTQLIVTASRPWCAEMVAEMIRNSINDVVGLFHVTVIVDCEEYSDTANYFYEAILEACNPWNEEVALQVIRTHYEALSDGATIIERRQRIIQLWNIAKMNVRPEAEYIISFEDDTFFPAYFFTEWLHMLKADQHLQYVEGAECHRRGAKAIGAWEITDKIVSSLPYNKKNLILQPIQGGGFYGFATRALNVIQADFREDGPAFGPDVCFVYDTLQRTKGKAVVDWRCECEHHLEDGSILFPWDSNETIVYMNINGEWQQV